MSKRITGQIEIIGTQFEEIKKSIGTISEYAEKINEYSVESLSDLFTIIFGGAINLSASDIHIEPEEKQARIRIRLDGILQDVLFVEKELYQRINSRIKLLSGIKINIENRPQDGRFSIVEKSSNLAIEIRTSTLPAEHGESIVMRVLNPEALIDLEKLGLRKDLLKIVEHQVKQPHGMIVVTGPTGSGKTTTLYAFCKKVKKPELKIITIEDPIEYHINGISQTQTNPEKGYTFASGLKSIMRQDPDIILVGEIRDTETVNTALQAALTGHLVLTTLHTNDAAGVVARLTALGADIANIGPAINMVIAQRLVRKVCPKCKKLKTISEKQLEIFQRELKDIIKVDSKTKIPEAVGCPECNMTGYKGRKGLFEILLIDEEFEKYIFAKPSIAQIREKAKEMGMTTIKQDGLIRVLEGHTTFEEIERITGE